MSASAKPATPATPFSTGVRALCLLLALPVLLLAPLYKIWPLDHLMSLALMLPGLGAIECLAETGALLYCPLTSLGEQHALTYGLPMVEVAALVRRFFPVELIAAWNLTALLVLFLAGLGAQAFFRQLGVDKWLAVPASMLFLMLPIVYAKSSYPLMLWGFALLPTWLWAQLAAWHWRSRFLAFLGLSLTLTVALFQEPYSFVMALTFGGWLTIARLVTAQRETLLDRSLRALSWVGAALLAVTLYRHYIPGGADYVVMPLDYFRGQGVDLLALMARNPDLFALGPLWGVGNLSPSLYFTDGEMTAHSYLGVALAIGLIAFVITVRPWRRVRHLVLLVAVVAAFVMALGPSLKIQSTAADRSAGDPVTFGTYLMPPEAAVTGLPHARIYEVPPFSNMRSVSRWYLLVAAGLVAMLSLVVQHLFRRGLAGAGAAVVLVLWTGVEYWPNFIQQRALGAAFGELYKDLDESLVGELDALLRPGERVVFISGERYSNEYFSTWLCARVGCRTYNVSGDKPRRISIARWPEAMRQRLTRPASAEARAELLDLGHFEVLIVPHFDMRWDSYTWPPPDERHADKRARAQAYHEVDGTSVISGKWFTVVRRASGGE